MGDLAHLATGTVLPLAGWNACLAPASLEGLLFITAVMFPSDGSHWNGKHTGNLHTKVNQCVALNIRWENCMQSVSYSQAYSGFWWKCCGFVCYYQSKIRKQQRKIKGLACGHLLANKPLCKFSWFSCHVKIVIIHIALCLGCAHWPLPRLSSPPPTFLWWNYILIICPRKIQPTRRDTMALGCTNTLSPRIAPLMLTLLEHLLTSNEMA